ncbi:MAG: nucleotidyltransferase domain-containing protein [Kiritimatiellae bacterium]|jgi:predicted nucleotidyltransferase|nr:nucleotidyltransferase domain-containing protein [Kiritimatiellia bacterium]
MMKSSEILTFLKNNKQRFESEYNLTQIGLFGSLARGEQTQDSDIDIIVEFRPNTEELHELKARLRKEIQDEFDRPVDICRLKYIKPVFRDSISREAKYV